MSTVQDFVAHYGTKGMKWGVRKRSRKEERARADRFNAAKKRRLLSDDDLKKRVERLNNEKKLKQLTEEDLTPGRAVTKKIMSESGQKVARTVVAGAALYGIKVAVESKFGKNKLEVNPKEAADFLVRGGIKKK